MNLPKQQSRPTQETRILEYLKSGKTLTQLQALPMFGCLRLGARVYNLVRKGYPIRSEMITTRTGKKVAQYSFSKN